MKDSQEKHDISGRSSHGNGFAHEAAQQLMIVLVTKTVHLGRGRVRACAGSDQRDTRVYEELV